MKHLIIKVLFCDCCNDPINENLQMAWKKGAFQLGTNDKDEIGTWCSEECYKEFQKSK